MIPVVQVHSPVGSEEAFTLLELLVVMVLIGLMAAVVAPGIGHSLVNLQLKTVTREISASLRYARSSAVAEKWNYLARFDLEPGRLTIARINETEEKEVLESTDQDHANEKEKTYEWPKTITLKNLALEEKANQEGSFDIAFFPNGSSSGGEFLISNERGWNFRISIDFITGLVSVDTGESPT